MSGISLDIDITHLEEICKKSNQSFFKCESTKHKNTLKSKNEILKELEEFLAKHRKDYSFVFTGHGYQNGDQCIKTKQNPDGEPLTIEEILDLMIRELPLSYRFFDPWSTINIYLDSCYSGKSLKRSKKHLGWNSFPLKYTFFIYASSGQNWTSVNTSFGGLLIAKLWFQNFQGDEKLKEDLKKKFEFRQPISFCYTKRKFSCDCGHCFMSFQKQQSMSF